VGGYQFTNDISVAFNTPYNEADATKLRYASTDVNPATANEDILLPVEGQEIERHVQQVEICQLARERAQEMSRLIALHLEDADLWDRASLRVVLTGGASNLPGLSRVMERYLRIPVRPGVPRDHNELPPELKGPAYATSVGILLWAVTEHVPSAAGEDSGTNGKSDQQTNSFLNGLGKMIGRLILMPRTVIASRKGRN
jgi:cell division protein FtsA